MVISTIFLKAIFLKNKPNSNCIFEITNKFVSDDSESLETMTLSV